MDHCTTTTMATSLVLILSLVVVTTAVPSTRNIHIVNRNLRSDLSEFCKKTTNPTLCAQTIQPRFLHSALDPFKALATEIDATLDKVKKTMADIETQLANSANTKPMKASLGICKDQYGSMLDAIDETKAAVARRDVITAKFKFSAVMSYQLACTDGFDGEKIPFAEDSNSVFQLGGNCLDIITLLEKAAAPLKTLPVKQTPSPFNNVIGTVS